MHQDYTSNAEIDRLSKAFLEGRGPACRADRAHLIAHLGQPGQPDGFQACNETSHDATRWGRGNCMPVLSDPLDFSLPPPWQKHHFAEQDILTRWRIDKHQAQGLPPGPEENAKAEARLVQMATRLQRFALKFGRACR